MPALPSRAPAPPAPATFANPILDRGADPWVVLHDGRYVLCQSEGGAIVVRTAARLPDLGRDPGTVVWRPPPGRPYSCELWAPECHLLGGRWFVYVAADDGANEHHRMYVLEGSGPDPRQPFTLKAKLDLRPDRWAIDGTVLALPDGRLYFLWSGWEGTRNVAQHLYVAPMRDPWTIAGPRVLLSRPEHPWERRGSPWVNEGPQVLWNADELFVVYSASGSWTDDYCLGLLRFRGGDVLDPRAWTKHPAPVFARTERVSGPGHASFTRAPDGAPWIVFHAARAPGAGWDRRVHAQPFAWDDDGSPRFGAPAAPGARLAWPAPATAPEATGGARPRRLLVRQGRATLHARGPSVARRA